MKKLSLTLTLALVAAFISFTTVAEARVLKFSGGPSGGTFQYYASGIAQLAKKVGIKVLASSSAGSLQNIRLVDAGKSNFAVAYSGDTFLAREGRLTGDTRKYTNVMAISRFYGAPAQLIVQKDSPYTSASQLKGKRVGVGNAGSGAAANAERFFGGIGIWDDMDRQFLGYRNAASAFTNKQLEAFWVFAGAPNSSVLEAALQNDIRLLQTDKDAKDFGVYKQFPFLTTTTIPANTYKGVDYDVETFMDNALWVASKKVSDEDVYKLVSKLYSDEGLKFMVSIHKSAKQMSVEKGTMGVVTPLHPGAAKFWKEKGVK